MREALFAAVWVLVASVSPGIAQSGAGESARTIVYARDGHRSVQIMLPEGYGVPGNNRVKYNRGSYEAYYGPYEVNEAAHTVTHHVEGALVRSLIGKDLTRVYRFEGQPLILTSSRPHEHWTIAWEHN